MRSIYGQNRALIENLNGGKSSGDSESPRPDEVLIECRWLTTEEAADYLRIHPGSLRNMVSNGTVKPSGKIGRLNRFLESDLRKLLLANR
jgi:excisionase family DNA binding protein